MTKIYILSAYIDIPNNYYIKDISQNMEIVNDYWCWVDEFTFIQVFSWGKVPSFAKYLEVGADLAKEICPFLVKIKE